MELHAVTIVLLFNESFSSCNHSLIIVCVSRQQFFSLSIALNKNLGVALKFQLKMNHYRLLHTHHLLISVIFSVTQTLCGEMCAKFRTASCCAVMYYYYYFLILLYLCKIVK